MQVMLQMDKLDIKKLKQAYAGVKSPNQNRRAP